VCVCSRQAGAFGPAKGQSKSDTKPSKRHDKEDRHVASSSADSEEEEDEDLKRDLKEEVNRVVRDGLKKDRDAKDDEAQKERNRLRKKIRKQHGKIEPSTKNKIRSIQRTLDRKGDKIPPEVQEKLRSRVEALKKDYDTVKLVEKEREYALKYRKIKFFERKKLERKLAQHTNALEDKGLSTKEIKSLKKKRDAVLADLQYVLYFPRDMRYVSIFNNPREVTDKLRTSEEFQSKMERARQIVLAYRASKLNQKQGSTQDTKPTSEKKHKKRDESQLESDEDESLSESEERQKKSRQKKRNKMLEHESPAPRKKARKVGAAAESDSESDAEEGSDEQEASDAQLSSKADVSDEKAFMEMMREEQRKNVEHFEALKEKQVSSELEESEKEEEEEAAGVRGPAKNARNKGKKKKGKKSGGRGADSSSEESEDSERGSEDLGDREDDDESEGDGEGEEIEGLKGFLRDDKPEPERRHRAENCLGPGDEDEPAPPKTPKAKGGMKKHNSNSNVDQSPRTPGAHHRAQGEVQREIGFMNMLPGSSQKAHRAQAEVQTESGFMDMLPGSSHNRMVEDSEDMDVTERLSIMQENDVSLPPMEAASTLFKHDDEKDMQTFLDGLNAEVAAGQTKDDLLKSSEDEDNDGMPEKADLCRTGTEVGMEGMYGVERRRQQMLDQMRAIDKQAQEEEDAKGACACVYIYACLYVCMYVCMYVCLYTHIEMRREQMLDHMRAISKRAREEDEAEGVCVHV
jgi:hypothetical protein